MWFPWTISKLRLEEIEVCNKKNSTINTNSVCNHFFKLWNDETCRFGCSGTEDVQHRAGS